MELFKIGICDFLKVYLVMGTSKNYFSQVSLFEKNLFISFPNPNFYPLSIFF